MVMRGEYGARGILHLASTLRTLISRKFFRDLRYGSCCARTAHHNRRLLHQQISSPCLEPCGCIRTSTPESPVHPQKRVSRRGMRMTKGRRRVTTGSRKSPGTAWRAYKNRSTHVFTLGGLRASICVHSPFFLSLPHPELLHSPSTIQNERRTHFFKRSGHCRERRHVLRS